MFDIDTSWHSDMNFATLYTRLLHVTCYIYISGFNKIITTYEELIKLNA